MKRSHAKPEHGNDKDYYYDSYKEFAWRFRIWLVVYGISVPFVVLNNESARNKVISSPGGLAFIQAALLVVLAQIAMTFAYKTCMWFCDSHAKGRLSTESTSLKLSNWFTEQYWIEAGVDLLSLVTFAYSTWQLLEIAFSKVTN